MKYALTLIAALAATPAAADVDAAVEDHILPGYAAFADAAVALENTAARDCRADAVRPAWNSAVDAWLRVSHLRFGPVEQDGRSVTIAFWPDERGVTPKTLAALIRDKDPIIGTPQGTAQISGAARGLYALEYLLYDAEFVNAGDYGCTLVQALARDLSSTAGQVNGDWKNGYARTMRTAGATGNATYLSEREARQALFTALLAGLEFDADERLGRPIGSFERPRPTRAENWHSARSQRNMILSLEALSSLAAVLSGSTTPQTDAAFAHAIALAEKLDDPDFAGVVLPSKRLKLEILQQAVRSVRDAAITEIGPLLGVTAGFNSADGD